MLRQWTDEIRLETRGRGFTEFTHTLVAFVQASGIRTGLLTVQILHTSASLLIQENADPGVRTDFERFFRRLVPDGDPLFGHDSEGPDDMPAHVRTALTTVNLSIPVVGGAPASGTWQGVYLWEHRTTPHRRRIVLHLIGES